MCPQRYSGRVEVDAAVTPTHAASRAAASASPHAGSALRRASSLVCWQPASNAGAPCPRRAGPCPRPPSCLRAQRETEVGATVWRSAASQLSAILHWPGSFPIHLLHSWHGLKISSGLPPSPLKAHPAHQASVTRSPGHLNPTSIGLMGAIGHSRIVFPLRADNCCFKLESRRGSRCTYRVCEVRRTQANKGKFYRNTSATRHDKCNAIVSRSANSCTRVPSLSKRSEIFSIVAQAQRLVLSSGVAQGLEQHIGG
jgi:hypothetical protein